MPEHQPTAAGNDSHTCRVHSAIGACNAATAPRSAESDGARGVRRRVTRSSARATQARGAEAPSKGQAAEQGRHCSTATAPSSTSLPSPSDGKRKHAPAPRRTETVQPKRPRRASDTAPSAAANTDTGAPRSQAQSVFTQVAPQALEQYRVDADGGDVFYWPDFITCAESAECYEALLALDTYHPTLKLYGRDVVQSRAVAAYATNATPPMRYSGTAVPVHTPPPPALAAVMRKVERELGVAFSHVLLNRYDDGDVYIGRHSDTRDNGVIASLSLGAERTFVMTPRLPPQAARIALSAEQKRELAARKSVKWALGDGSLVLMQGKTQDFWKHEIPREPQVRAGRISLTFRQLM